VRRFLLKQAIRAMRFFWFITMAGLASIFVGRNVSNEAVGALFHWAGLGMVCIGGVSMIADRARRMSQHEREQRSRFGR
jgi:hypothetical protein